MFGDGLKQVERYVWPYLCLGVNIHTGNLVWTTVRQGFDSYPYRNPGMCHAYPSKTVVKRDDLKKKLYVFDFFWAFQKATFADTGKGLWLSRVKIYRPVNFPARMFDR